MSPDRRLDVITLGRSSVDLYGEQIGGRLEDMASFAKYVGGCPTNIAVGAARLGLGVGLVTRVGDEHMGRFVRETLAAEGIDVSHVSTDPERLTALVILGIRSRESFPLIFYRENCADMALRPEHVGAEFIASARALVVTGTHFSTPGVDAASRHAMTAAKAAGTRVVLDIDYRPVLWGVTSHGEGEERFRESGAVTAHLQTIVPDCDLIVGTEEEIHIAGGSTDTMAALRRLRELTAAAIVVKRGPMGCVVFPDAIPERIGDGVAGPGFPVEVFNVLGAGDAFMAGFLRGWVRGEPWETCCRWANACGALVVSRHGCAPAMPSWREVTAFLARGDWPRALHAEPALARLHRVSTGRAAWPEVCALAFDHRSQLEEMADRAGQPRERIDAFKALVASALKAVGGQLGIQGLGALVDGRYGAGALSDLAGSGLWLARPVEKPGSRPLAFEAGAEIGLELRSWPVDHVAKCLVFYHPDDPEDLRAAQEERLRALADGCARTGRELLVEVIPPRSMPADDGTVARALERLYAAGIRPDWWKLPPPDREGWSLIRTVIAANDPDCRGVLMLGLDAPEAQLLDSFAIAAAEPLCKGFAVGRSIFGAPARAWFAGEMDDAQTAEAVAAAFMRLVRAWRRMRHESSEGRAA